MASPVRPNLLPPAQPQEQKGAPQPQGTEQKGAPPASVRPTPQQQAVQQYWHRPPAHPAATPQRPGPAAPAQPPAPPAPAPVQAQPAAPATGAPKRVPVGHKFGCQP